MSNKPVEALVVSPFYRTCTSNTIRCEAAPPANDFMMRFTSHRLMDNYLRLQCADFIAHRSCPFAGLLYERYEDAPEDLPEGRGHGENTEKHDNFPFP